MTAKKSWDENTDSEEENASKRRKRRKKFDSSEDEDEDGSSDEEKSEKEEEDVKPIGPSARTTRASRRSAVKNGEDFVEDDVVEEKKVDPKCQSGFSEWYDEFLTPEDETNVELSGKLVIMLEIIANAEVVGDKVLVFTQSLASLDLIESALGGGSVNGNQLNWCHGIVYFRMDGSTPVARRKRWSDIFNDPDNDRFEIFVVLFEIFIMSVKRIKLSIT